MECFIDVYLKRLFPPFFVLRMETERRRLVHLINRLHYDNNLMCGLKYLDLFSVSGAIVCLASRSRLAQSYRHRRLSLSVSTVGGFDRSWARASWETSSRSVWYGRYVIITYGKTFHVNSGVPMAQMSLLPRRKPTPNLGSQYLSLMPRNHTCTVLFKNKTKICFDVWW